MDKVNVNKCIANGYVMKAECWPFLPYDLMLELLSP